MIIVSPSKKMLNLSNDIYKKFTFKYISNERLHLIYEPDFTEGNRQLMFSMDSIDNGILALLGKNSRANAPKISKELSEMQISLSDRAVLQRIERLEEKKIIQGYTATLDPSILAQKSISMIFLKFVPSVEEDEIEKLDTYLIEASFCLSATRLREAAKFDYSCQLVFDTKKQFELMISVILRRFGRIISECVPCQSEIIKQVPYRVSFDTSLKRNTKAVMISLALSENVNMREKLRQFTKNIFEFFEAKCVCLWLIDKKKDELTLTNAYGNYEYFPTGYANISWNSINIDSILETGKPVLVNDLVSEPKCINLDWLMAENIQSYAGYPLKGKDGVVGVLEIFNEKAFSPVDFELLQYSQK
jgi:DNA-binding Lrp family transcriptional regulator